MTEYERLALWYKRVTWLGIFLNMLFVFPLMFAPRFALDILQLNVEPLIWARVPGLLLFTISVFYIPASFDLKRYWIHAWIAICPSRAGGSLFFFIAVFVFGCPWGFLPIAFVDLFILSIQLVLLLKIRKLGVIPRDETKAKKMIIFLVCLLILAALLAGIVHFTMREVPQGDFASVEEYFKYGSIGTELEGGIPYWIWTVLPRLFPEYLPGPGGYASLGLPWERGQPLPVGFSKKTIGFERVGINCAFCHVATVREQPGLPAKVYPAGPSHTFDVLAYQRFLFACGKDPRFHADNIMTAIAQIYDMPLLERMLYRYLLIPGTRKALIELADQFAWTDSRPDWGRGRIDPFNPVKVAILGVGVGNTIGNSDMVPIWNLGARDGMAFHWDGLNRDLTEVFLSSTIGDGATPKTLPFDKIEEMKSWLRDLPPPAYPFDVDRELAARGEAAFDALCAGCHAFGGARTGQVIPVAEVGTDPHRLEMWTQESADAYNAYADGYDWDFEGFRSTDGYVAVPLDAVWIRGPYLHNGSVPSLRDLLEPPGNRPREFHRGYDVYDPVAVGFVSSGAEAERYGTRHDTSEPGNGNQGHLWGTDLSSEDKEALIEYLKTL